MDAPPRGLEAVDEQHEEACLSCGGAMPVGGDFAFECLACIYAARRRRLRHGIISGAVLAVSCSVVVAVASHHRPTLYGGHGIAALELSRTAAMEPHNVEVRYRLAAELEQWDALVEAESVYDDILRIDDQEYVAWVRRAVVRHHRGNPVGAISDLEQALYVTSAPTADALAYLGYSYSRIENWSAAVESFVASIAIDPDIARVRFELSHAFEEVGDVRMAAQSLATGLELDPGVSDARELRERLRMLRLQAGLPESDVAGVDPVWIPLVRYANVMTLDVRINDLVDTRLVLDTGASFTTVNQAVANELGLHFQQPARIVTAATANGNVILPVYRIAELAVGGAIVRDVEVGVCDACGTDTLDGLLGLNFTENYLVTIDTELSAMILTPRSDGAAPGQRAVGARDEVLGTFRD